MQHCIVLSDLHLWQAIDRSDLWMRYRHHDFFPDSEIAALLKLLCAQIPNGEIELVLNGDIFDFDVPPLVQGQPAARPSPRTEEASVARMRQILTDHEVFLSALAALLRGHHRVVFIAGNHDLQLNFPEVRALLIQRIVESFQRCYPEYAGRDVKAQISFQPWFHQTSHGVHIEHGNQYDPYCSVPDPLWPYRFDRQLETNVSTLMLEHLAGKLGYLNPNVETTFVRTPFEYLAHWFRYCLPTTRLVAGSFFLGSLHVVWETARAHGLLGPGRRTASLQSEEAAAHTALFAVTDLRNVIRLLYVDRMLLLTACTVTALLFRRKVALGVLGALGTVGLRQWLQPQFVEELGTVADAVAHCARRIAPIYGARAVVFGHTHRPEGRWEGDVFYGNSGSWAPMHRDVACNIPVERDHPFIWLRQEADSLRGGLYRFCAGQILPAGEQR